jgi:hypothetical protein
MNYFSIQAYSLEELTEQLAQVPFQPNLGIAFASVALDIEQVVATLAHLDFPIVGSSSCGEFIHDARLENANPYQEVISSEAMVLLLMELPENSFAVHQQLRTSVTSDYELGASIGRWATSCFEVPNLIVLTAGLSMNGDELVRGISHIKADMTVFGGLAGDDSHFNQTFVFTKAAAIDQGVVAIAFDGKVIEMVGNSVSGWQGIGAMKTVTHSEGNVVYTIDRQPALDTYIHYLNITEDELPQVGVDYPILLKQGKESILRAVVMVDKQDRKSVV